MALMFSIRRSVLTIRSPASTRRLVPQLSTTRFRRA
jgi:hypothetical protein